MSATRTWPFAVNASNEDPYVIVTCAADAGGKDAVDLSGYPSDNMRANPHLTWEETVLDVSVNRRMAESNLPLQVAAAKQRNADVVGIDAM